MDFLKRLFGGKKTTEINMALPPGLAEALFQNHGGQYEPVFMLKDHPKVLEFIEQFETQSMFFRKQIESLNEQHAEAKNAHWASIEGYMRDNSLWPSNERADADLCLTVRDGVLYNHRHV